MKRLISRLVLALGTISQLLSCSCDYQPVCRSQSADLIFLGRVTFTNDERWVTGGQETYVRFEVEEAFKGVAPGVRQIWVDPGNGGSCYAAYKLDNRYLVTARHWPDMRGKYGLPVKTKPLPPDFTSSTPIYWSPACSSRPANRSPDFERDLAMARAYRSGTAMPRILGQVYLSAYSSWPKPDGPGADITISNGTLELKTTVDGEGRFSFQNAPPGEYTVNADLPPYQMNPNPNRHSVNGRLQVPQTGCGYSEIELATTSMIKGVVLDPKGRGVPEISVVLKMKDGSLGGLSTTTDKEGRFATTGVPDTDVFVFAGATVDSWWLGESKPGKLYSAVYYPARPSVEGTSGFRLKLGETRSVVLRFGEPLKWTRAKFRVVDKDGRPKSGAGIGLDGPSSRRKPAESDATGLASVPCLRGWSYQADASVYRWLTDGKREIMKTSKTPFVCGESNIPKVLVLDRLIGGILAGQTVDAKGLPLKRPRVRVYLEREINPRYEAEGDDEGQFRIEGISPGTYKIGIAIVGLGEKTYSDVGIVAPFTTELGVMVWI